MSEALKPLVSKYEQPARIIKRSLPMRLSTGQLNGLSITFLLSIKNVYGQTDGP